MNSYIEKLLSASEFIQTDAVTYNVTVDFPHLFNAVAFDYDMLEWVVVGQAQLSCQISIAYALAFSKK